MIDFENYAPFPKGAIIQLKTLTGTVYSTEDETDERKLIKIDSAPCPFGKIALAEKTKQTWFFVDEIHFDFNKTSNSVNLETKLFIVLTVRYYQTRDADGMLEI